MKVLCIYPDLVGGARGWVGHFYSGIGYLSAILKAAGHDVGLIHIIEPVPRHEFIQQLNQQDPDLVGFSTTSLMYPYVCQYATWVREWRPVFTICGGVHTTLCPDEVMNSGLFDAICVGEGEEAIVELAEALVAGRDYSDIRNLWIRKGANIIRNPLRPLIADLDSLPFPDRSLFYQPNTFAEQGIARIMASRGCPYRCSHCANNALARIYSGLGPYVRFRSPENVIREIEALLKSPSSPQALWFDDDILPCRMDWFREFASLYRERVGIPYECYLRPNLVTHSLIKLLAESGCYRVHLGVETGSEYLRARHLNRHISNTQIRQAFALCQEANIETVSLNMVGLPQEDMHHALETIKLNAALNPSRISVSIFYPFPGTDLYLKCKAEALLSTRQVDNVYSETILQHVPLCPEQIHFLRRRFSELVWLYQRLQGHVGTVITKMVDAILCSGAFRWVLRITDRKRLL